MSARPSLKLAKIFLKSGLANGEVVVAIRDQKLPIDGVSLILGNDLAGTLVVPNVTVVDTPLPDSPTKSLEKDQPNLFPMCAVTRSKVHSQVDKSLQKSSVKSMLPSQIITKDNLIKAQQADSTLAQCVSNVVDKELIDKMPSFYCHDGILMRVFRPPEMSKLDTWSEVHQIVVPTSIRKSLMELAHESLSGHLGINKTYKKLLQHYFWPGIKKDVGNFVRSCHVCQIVGNPNQVIPVAPLKPIPVMSEPFEKIVIDCVGPLPKTKKGNQYLLTVMCTATRYPEAFPLKNISSKNIVKCLLQFFTSVGIPKEIQCDQGTNFTSDLFQQVLKELNITQQLSSAYHPQSQGCLERFHQTFKSMLKKYCMETTNDWDENIPYLLFALRECPQESLGYSPFELLYGRQIRGPLKVLKEQWFSDAPVHPNITVAQYISNLKTKLSQVRKLALANLSKSQAKMKRLYDVKTKSREFAPGDKVLLFLPIPGNPLKSKFTGPYIVSHKLSKLNYVISTPDRRKDQQLVHVNLIKPYVERLKEDLENRQVLNNVIVSQEREEDSNVENDFPSPKINPLNSDIIGNLSQNLEYLNNQKKSDITNLLYRFPEVSTDVLGHCSVLKHDVQLSTEQVSPLRQPAYRVNPRKKEIMKKEVEYLLTNNLAEPSKSPWASPCLLIPKPDGSSRFCTDYRKVNKVTVPDSYPLPRIDDLLDAVGQSKFVTTIDLQKGYYQIELTEKAKLISAFITPFGLFQYRVMPFGMMNAPATFQRAINFTIQGIEGIFAYIDDIVIIADSWEEHLSRLTALFTRLREVGFTINLAKSTFGCATVTYLGHVVGRGMARPKQANVEAILSFPTPTDRKSVMRFLGMAGYYRRFCSNFAAVATPLSNLTSPKTPFIWTPRCDAAFQQLKTLLSSNPVLRTPDHSRAFTLHVDASSHGVGAVLLQEDINTQVLHPVSYFSAKLKPHQRKYSTIELEALSLVLALKKFDCYLHQHPYSVQVFSDHNPLVFLSRMQHSNQRLLRWALLIQQYHLDIHHIKGAQNVLADALSRGFSHEDT